MNFRDMQKEFLSRGNKYQKEIISCTGILKSEYEKYSEDELIKLEDCGEKPFFCLEKQVGVSPIFSTREEAESFVIYYTVEEDKRYISNIKIVAK